MPVNAGHPQFAVMQNMVLAQHLHKEQMEIEAKRTKVDERVQSDMLERRIERLLDKNREEQIILQRRIEERMEKLSSIQT